MTSIRIRMTIAMKIAVLSLLSA